MTALAEFLFPAPARRSVGGILLWWEARRLHYNALVGAAGLFSLTVLAALHPFLTGPGELFLPWQPVVAFGVLANVCYSLGPVVEIVVVKLWDRQVLPVGPALFRIGLTFSVGLALFPTLLAMLAVVARIVVSVL